MTIWQYLLSASAGALLILAGVLGALRSRRERKNRDFTRTLETLLQPRETVKVICPQKRFRCILTNRRILFEEKGSFSAFPLKAVRKVAGKNKAGNRTGVPANMVSCTVTLEREYTLHPAGPEFQELVRGLQEAVKKQKEKKPGKK